MYGQIEYANLLSLAKLLGDIQITQILLIMDPPNEQLQLTKIQIAHKKLICRICLSSKQKLIQCCGCQGSIGFIHESCMITWISINQNKTQLKQNNQYYLRCEICKVYIYFLKNDKRRCSDAEHIKKKIKQNLLSTMIKCSLFIICLSLIGVLIYFQRESKQDLVDQEKKQQSQKNSDQIIILIAAISVFSIIAIKLLQDFIWNYLLKQQKIITKVISNSQNFDQKIEKIISHTQQNYKPQAYDRNSIVLEDQNSIIA